MKHLLFRGIVQLVFSASLEGLLDIGIDPEVLNCDGDIVGHVFTLDLRWQAHDDTSISTVGIVVKWQLHLVHGFQNHAHTTRGEKRGDREEEKKTLFIGRLVNLR